MKKLNYVLLFSFILFLIAGCSKDDYLDPVLDESDLASSSLKAAKKPAPNLRGDMELDFNLAVILDITGTEPSWEGTIDIDGYGVYGMRFFSLGTPKGFSQASPFMERFEIYDLVAPNNPIYMIGHDAGVTTLANSKYRMNGEIDVAIGPFEEEWIGRKVHMSGDILNWQPYELPNGVIITVPLDATGTFRIN